MSPSACRVRSARRTVALDPATVAALRGHLARRGGAWEGALAEKKNVRAAVNQDMAKPGAAIRAGDEIAFFPPVTGG